MRLLLDKGIVRRVMEGLARVDVKIPLTAEQRVVLKLLQSYNRRTLYSEFLTCYNDIL